MYFPARGAGARGSGRTRLCVCVRSCRPLRRKQTPTPRLPDFITDGPLVGEQTALSRCVCHELPVRVPFIRGLEGRGFGGLLHKTALSAWGAEGRARETEINGRTEHRQHLQSVLAQRGAVGLGGPRPPQREPASAHRMCGSLAGSLR